MCPIIRLIITDTIRLILLWSTVMAVGIYRHNNWYHHGGYYGGHYHGGGNTVVINNRNQINHYNNTRNTSNRVQHNNASGNYGNGNRGGRSSAQHVLPTEHLHQPVHLTEDLLRQHVHLTELQRRTVNPGSDCFQQANTSEFRDGAGRTRGIAEVAARWRKQRGQKQQLGRAVAEAGAVVVLVVAAAEAVVRK